MQHSIVSQDEWLAARKAHLAAEKAFTKARDELSRQRRELPWVKVEKNYVFDTPARQEDAVRAVRRPQPADRQALHAGAGPEGRLRRLLVRGRSCRRRPAAYRASRREIRVGRACTARRDRGVQDSGWAGASTGCRPTAPTSTTTSTSPSRPSRWRSGKVYLQLRGDRGSARGPVRLQRLLQGTSTARSSTPIRAFGRGADDVLGSYMLLDIDAQGPQRERPNFALTDWVRHHDRYERRPCRLNRTVGRPPKRPIAAARS